MARTGGHRPYDEAASGRAGEAERLGLEVLASAPDAGAGAGSVELGRIAAAVARIRIDRDGPTEPTRSFLADHWARWISPEILAAIRDLDNACSDRAEYYRLVVHGKLPETGPQEIRGFFCTYDVVADSPAEALQYIERLDRREPVANLSIEESRVLEPRPRDPLSRGAYLNPRIS